MTYFEIEIFQGNQIVLPPSDVNIVIDVIRAFTFAHVAFTRGAKGIVMAASVDEARAIKRQHPDFLLAGEVGGLHIDGFDYDNSPYRLHREDLSDKTLIQKTTNGVTATLQALAAPVVLVTGFSNALATALYVKSLFANPTLGQEGESAERVPKPDKRRVQIVASHPTSDEDLACAEYIKTLLATPAQPSMAETLERIVRSAAAQKFFANDRPEFDPRDIAFCLTPATPEFAMRVFHSGRAYPVVERVNLT